MVSKGHSSIELAGDPYHEDVGVDWQELSTSVLLALVFINGVVEAEPAVNMFEVRELTFLLKTGGDFRMVTSDGGRRVSFLDVVKCGRDDLSD